MPILTGEQVGELQKLLVDAFKLDELMQLVRIKMDVVLAEIVAVSRPMLNVCFDFIEWLEHRNRIREFLSAIRVERPSVPEVQLFCGTLLAMQGTEDGLGSPLGPNKILALVVEFRVIFSKAQIWFRRLGAYKALHDVLHKLQDQQVATQLAARDFRVPPNDPLPLRIIADSLEDDLVARARQALPETEFPDKAGRWVFTFDQVVQNLRIALDPPDFPTLDRAVAILGTLHNQQADLNGELVSCAKRLDTDELIHRMESILAGLSQIPADRAADLRARLSQFKASCQRMAALTLDHDACQDVETSLAPVDPAGASSKTVFLWPDVMAGLLRIAARRPDDRMAARMAEYTRAFDVAKDQRTTSYQFILLREQFGRLFHNTDEDLLTVTERLIQDADKLSTELGVIV